MVSFPSCKINLGLHVLRKRSDGYHDIETCFYPLPFTDVLEILPSEKMEFTSSGISIPGEPGQNLCLKAYHLVKTHYSIPPVKMHLHKCIPAGAGLGGGSSDAAHTLKLLNELFNLGMGDDELMRHASAIGSDCSFFIQNSPMIGRGRGELLSSANLSLKGKFLVLLNPSVHVSTAEAYNGVTPRVREKEIPAGLARPLEEWKDNLANDFEKSVFERHPLIQEVREALYTSGAVYASMSGSGSSVFGIFSEEPALNPRLKDYVIWKGVLTL